MKCKCGNEWVYQKHSWPAQGDMLYCVTCNVGWDAEDVISELEAENKRLREAIREIADGKHEHYLASNPRVQYAATVFAKAALKENNDES